MDLRGEGAGGATCPGGDPLSQEEPSGGFSSFSRGAASAGELPAQGPCSEQREWPAGAEEEEFGVWGLP